MNLNHRNKSSIRKQTPIKAPRISASLRLLFPIFPIKAFTPGTWLAAPTILRLMLVIVSRWMPKFSLIAYAWLSTPSITPWLSSMRRRSSNMYSASAAAGFEERNASMSDRTFERRFARSRDSAIADVRRDNSRLWSVRISRWRARLFCLRAEEVSVASESRRRASWATKDSRFWPWVVSKVAVMHYIEYGRTFSRRSLIWVWFLDSSSEGCGGSFVIDANWE